MADTLELPPPLPVPAEGDQPGLQADVAARPGVQPSTESQGTLTLPPPRDTRLHDSYESASRLNPDQAGETLALSRKTGLDPAYVAANLDEARRVAGAPSADDLDHLQQHYPKTADFLAKLENMAATHDDLGNLARHEKIAQDVREVENWREAFKSGLQGSTAGMMYRGALPDLRLPAGAPIAHRLMAQIGSLAGDIVPMAAGEVLGEAGGEAAGAVAGGALAGPYGALALGWAGAAMGGSAGAFGFPALIKEYLREKYSGEPIQPGKIAKDAAIQGGVGALTGFAGLAAEPSGALAKGAAEVATMASAGAAAERRLPTAADFLDTAVLVAGLHGVQKLGETAVDSKLRARDPEGYRDHVDSVLTGLPIQTAQVPVEAFERYFQSARIDPAAAAAELGVEKSYESAKETGAHVDIPMRTFLGKEMDAHRPKLMDDVTFTRPDGVTPLTMNERRERAAGIEQGLQAEAQNADAAVKKDAALAAGGRYVYNDVFDKLSTMQRPDGFDKKAWDAAIEKYATAWQNRAIAAASRRGVKPEAWYNGVLSDIVRGDVESGGSDFGFGENSEEFKEHIRAASAEAELAHLQERGGITPAMDYIRQELGGIDRDDAKRTGLYAELPDMEWTGIFRKGGVKVDHAVESMAQKGVGHIAEADRDLLVQKVRDEALALGDFKTRFGEKAYQKVRRNRGLLSQEEVPPQDGQEPGPGSDGEGQPQEPSKPAPVVQGPFDSSVTADPRFVKALETAAAHTGENPDRLTALKAYFKALDDVHDVKNIGNKNKVAEAAKAEGLDNEVVQRNLLSPEQKVALKERLTEAFGRADATKRLAFTAYHGAPALDYFEKLDKGETPEAPLKDPYTIHQYEQRLFQDDARRADVEKVAQWLQTAKPTSPFKQSRLRGLAEDLRAGRAPDEILEAARKVLPMTTDPETGETLSSGDPDFPRTHTLEAFLDNYENEDPAVLEQAAGGKGNRGYFDPVHRVIGLMKSADASTFLHESAHAWITDEFNYIKSGKASEEYMKDWKVLSGYLGVEDGQDKLTRDQQEKFAKSFEAYVAEGKAPSKELRRPFAAFRKWLTNVYRDVTKSLGVKVTPEVAKVMDRMLATDSEIREAERNMYRLSEEDLSKLDPEEAGWIRAAQSDAREEAVSGLLKEQMGEVTAKRVEFLDKERARVTGQIAEDLKASPVYRATDELRKWFGDRQDGKALAGEYLGEKMTEERRVKFDDIAEAHGFSNGHDMATQLSAEPPFEEKVKAQAGAYMSQYADLKDTERIKEAAEKAVHNDKQLELLAMEGAAMGRAKPGKQGELAPVTEAVKAQRRAEARWSAQEARAKAKELLAAKSVDEATAYRPYVTAERNAAVKAAQAAMRGDFETAQKYKGQQLLNHALAMEAMRNKAEGERAMKFLDKYAGRKQDFKNMPYGFIRQIDALLEAGGIKEHVPEDTATNSKIAQAMADKGEDSSAIANATGLKATEKGWQPETIQDFIQRANDDNLIMPLPGKTATGGLQPFPHLTMADLRDLKMAVQVINEIGRGHDNFLSFESKVGIKAAAEELNARVTEKIGAPYADKLAPGFKNDAGWKDKLEAITSLPDKMIPELVNVRTLCHFLDGGAEGPAHDYILNPLERATNWKLDRRAKMMEEVRQLFAQHYKPEELASYKTERSYTFGGRKWTKEQILMTALNWGNEGNRDRIMRGFGLDQVGVRQMLDVLDHRDWEFAQGVWNHLESYWPEIKAQEMAVNGFEPSKVPSAPIETRYGNYAGGYFPLAYDFDKSGDAFRTEERKNALYKQYSAVAAHTEHGFTQGRVDTMKRPVRLSFDVLFNHLENVVHDLAYRKAVIDVQRFLRQGAVKDALTGAIDVRGYDAFSKALKAVASDQGEFLSGADKFYRWFRFGGTFATLGYRATTFPLRLAGDFTNAAWEIGPSRLAGAMKDYYLGDEASKAWVDGKSALMRGRADTRERDLLDLSKTLTGEGGGWRRHAFIVDTLADRVVSYPMWTEVYKRTLADHPEAEAVRIADDAIARSFGSGTILDQVGAQRGGELKKLTSMYYSWTSMMFNRAWLDGKIAGLEYREGNRGAAAGIVAKTVFYSWVLPGLYENVVREAFRNNQTDDDKARGKRILARTLELPFGYMPLVRDIAAAGINKALGERGADYKMTPVEDAIDTALDTASKTASIMGSDNKHFDERWSEEAARSAAIVFKYPQQVNTWAFNFLDWMQDKGEATWRDMLTRRTKK